MIKSYCEIYFTEERIVYLHLVVQLSINKLLALLSGIFHNKIGVFYFKWCTLVSQKRKQ